MTVCVAVMCQVQDVDGEEGQAIIFATDQLLTDLGTYETSEVPQQKNIVLAPSVLALVSGDMADALAVCRRTLRNLEDSPTDDVEDIAQRVGFAVAEETGAQFQRRYFDKIPNPPTVASLYDGTSWLSAKMQKKYLDLLDAATLDDVHLIIAGVDGRGAHLLYVDSSGEVKSAEPRSFAAVGSGADLAREHLGRLEYHRSWGRAQAIFAAYLAKRRSELVLGVGDKYTTVNAITAAGIRPGYSEITDPLKHEYKTFEEASRRAFDRAVNNCGDCAYDLLHDNKLWLMQQIREGAPQARAPEHPPASTHDS